MCARAMYESGDYDASVFFALSLEKAIFVPGVVTKAAFRTEEFLRPNAELDSLQRTVNSLTQQGDR